MTSISFPNLGLTLDPPEFFSIGPLNIYFYGLIIALGLMLAVIYGLRRCNQFGIKQDDILDGVLWIVPLAIICARAYYCILSWDEYANNPIEALYIWNGGLAIYGGVIGAVIGVLVFCKVKRINLGAVLDLMLLGFLIGQSIGRWGNFFNREAFGCYTEGLLAMRIPASSLIIPADASDHFLQQVAHMKEMATAGGYEGFIQVHPTFLYESLWNAAGFVALHFLSKKRQYDGQIALGYVAWYGLGRTLIEGLRMDSLGWGDLRFSQVLAAASCVIALVILLWQAFRPHDKAKLFVNRVAATEAAETAIAEETFEETDGVFEEPDDVYDEADDAHDEADDAHDEADDAHDEADDVFDEADDAHDETDDVYDEAEDAHDETDDVYDEDPEDTDEE